MITIGTPDGQRELWSIKMPRLLSFLATGNFDGEVQGIRELQAAYEATYGPGTYSPNIPLTYWTFRWMIALGHGRRGRRGRAALVDPGRARRCAHRLVAAGC